jgi:hypothetical protein
VSAVYEQCGVRLRSEVPLDLPVATDGEWDVDARWGDDIHDSAAPPPGEVVARYETNGNVWYTATETALGYRLRFANCGEFVIAPDLSSIEVRRDPGGRHDLLPILLAGTASALLLTLRGAVVLHASAVAVDGAALAFVGQSGRGKSTVAALMCLDGAALVTDDVLRVDPGPPVTCVGGASELRLRAAAAHLADEQADRPSRTTADARRAFAPVPAPPGPLELAGIVIPSPSRQVDDVEVQQLPASDAMFAVMSFPRIHGWRRRDILTREFTTLSRIVNQIPIYHATIPWGPPFSPGVAVALRDLVS